MKELNTLSIHATQAWNWTTHDVTCLKRVKKPETLYTDCFLILKHFNLGCFIRANHMYKQVGEYRRKKHWTTLFSIRN